MTDRLYYSDSYLVKFEATVEEAAADGRRLYLTQSAFYPTSGGQLHDLGEINGIAVVEVVDEDDRVAHVLAEPVTGKQVSGLVDWPRRFDHMQQHTGQHLLSAVFEEMLGAQTLSVHFGDASATIDLAVPALSPNQLVAIEKRANQAVFQNLPVVVAYEDAATVTGLRKPSERPGILRIVSIEGLDKSACGGTHVTRTGEIGPILIRKLDKIRGNVRVEFICGQRAVAQSRLDFDALSSVSRHFSCPLDEAAGAVAQLTERAKDQDKAIRLLKSELAAFQGKQLHQNTPAGVDGIRRHSITVAEPIADDLRMLAQNFVACGKAVLQIGSTNPASLLLACSADSNLHAGNLLKTVLAAAGGRGGGSNTLAQASLPSVEALEKIRLDLSKLGA